MTPKQLLCAAFAAAAIASARAGAVFDAGADMRVRQEFYDNIPALPGGGVVSHSVAGTYANRFRFRARAWAQIGDGESWRVYSRVMDECRWFVRPRNHAYAFPDELILDNLYIEANGLFDGLLDVVAGRQDIAGLFGLERVFSDATPGDGSRSVFSNVVRAGLDFDEAGRLDLFALYNMDDEKLRCGTRRSRRRTMTGFGGGAEPEMDDWGWGAVYSGDMLSGSVPYKVFAMQKISAAFRRGGEKHPSTRRELAGFQFAPRLTRELSLLAEAMGQIGRNGDGDWLAAWSACAGMEWKSAHEGGFRPFARTRIHLMSGDRDAPSEEGGGNNAWDPMWARGTNDSEIFTAGGMLYGSGWWSNMVMFKNEAGLDLGARHSLTGSVSPVFAARENSLGGGDGRFKGVLSQFQYEFPLVLPDRAAGERLEIFGHVIAELFNPGDYYETGRPAWFVRWQLVFSF